MTHGDRYVAVATVARPHGLTGEVRVTLFDPESDLLLGRPPVRLVLGDGTARAAKIVSARRVPKALLVRLDAAKNRDGAAALAGAGIEVARSALPPARPGEYYHCDLEGCAVFFGQTQLGPVRRVLRYPSCDALVLSGPRAIEIPLTDAFIARVDILARRIELSAVPE